MAYTLTDPFRGLRTVLRVSGATASIAAVLLLFLPKSTLVAWGLLDGGSAWPFRLAGALLLTLGIFYLLAAGERVIGVPTMITGVVGNGLTALVLVISYLQRELDGLALAGQLVLIAVCAICLIGAVTPLRYLRAEYRSD